MVPFSPQTLLHLVQRSLPLGNDAEPQLKSLHDAIAVIVHACMLSVGFRLVGLSEDDRLDVPIQESDLKPLPANWNASPGSYGFRYAHAQSSMQFMIKINRLGNKTHIMGLGMGDDRTTSFDVATQDFISESFIPYAHAVAGSGILADAFISESRIRDLASLVKINIVQKLVPGLAKPGYEEEPVQGNMASNRRQEEERESDRDPLRVPRPYVDPFVGPGGYPRPGSPPVPAGGERPPGFDDDYEILQPPRGLYRPGGRHPLSIGEDDLNPPGLAFPGGGRGRIGSMNPMGGMHPTGDHPMFGGRGSGPYVDSRAPPGARYDPVGPGDEPRGGLRGPRGPRGPGSNTGPGALFNPFSSFRNDDFI